MEKGSTDRAGDRDGEGVQDTKGGVRGLEKGCRDGGGVQGMEKGSTGQRWGAGSEEGVQGLDKRCRTVGGSGVGAQPAVGVPGLAALAARGC